MSNRSTSFLAGVFLTVSVGLWPPAYAQMSEAPIPSALPDLGLMSPGNAAGVLTYCVAHELVSSATAEAVIDGLKADVNVVKSPEFAAGQGGTVISGKQIFSIGQSPGYLQSRTCDLVLRKAKAFH